jgi:hypothetical protein
MLVFGLLFGVVCDPSGAQGTLSIAVHEASQPCALDPCDQACDSLVISLGIQSVLGLRAVPYTVYGRKLTVLKPYMGP